MYNLLPPDTSPRNGAPAHPPTGETQSDEVRKCQEQLNLQKKYTQKIHEGKTKIKNKNKLN